jgi:hypothetical protein
MIFPPDSIYGANNPSKYYVDFFETPTHPDSGVRHFSHYVHPQLYDWPIWWTSANGGRGNIWHHAVIHGQTRPTSTGFSPQYTTHAQHPLKPKYNKILKRHEYPFAESPISNYQITGTFTNPLSNASTFGGFPNLIFSDFRHYIFPTPLNFEGTPYTVTSTEPIRRTSFGGQYVTLDRISTWSPYNGSVWIDFTNNNSYDNTLQQSSIWS